MITILIVYLIPLFLLRKSGAAAILAALAVTLATGFVAFNVLVAAGWSSLHGALSEGAFHVLFVIAAVAPPTLGFLAGILIRRRLGKQVAPDAIGPR